MTSIKSIFLSLFVVSIASAQTTVTVSTPKELLNSIGPNKTIYLNPGDYDLSSVSGEGSSFVTWEDEYDGSQILISNVSNLKIIGKGNARVLVKPSYTWVMKFYKCENIQLDNYTLGHTIDGYCTGGVIYLDSCKNVKVTNCKMFGSGTYGMGIYSTQNVTVEKCDIYKCTYGLLQLFGSTNLNFIKTRFRETGMFDLITISGCKTVNFKTCVFEKNNGSNDFEYSDFYFFRIDDSYYDNYEYEQTTPKSSGVTINTSVFRENKTGNFTNDYSNIIKLGDNKFERNNFTKPLPSVNGNIVNNTYY
jgi:polygalacturonase